MSPIEKLIHVKGWKQIPIILFRIPEKLHFKYDILFQVDFRMKGSNDSYYSQTAVNFLNRLIAVNSVTPLFSDCIFG